MILNPNSKQADSQTIGIDESISMTIDTSDQAALMMILSENLYKDPIGSLVREAASNALDATKKANSATPIIVKLALDRGHNWIFSVQDFGTGISPDEVKNVLSKYAASTKRNSNDYLGYYGLGFKAPLAYTDSFYFITRWGGMEYTYMMYKGEAGTKIDLVNEQILPLEEEFTTGTTVTVQLHSRNDQQEFVRKIEEQLAYFEGVYFEVAGINNSFKIIKSIDWKYSELNQGSEMHICLSDVHYDIDWKKMKMQPILLPIGLNFNLNDGLMPIPSREDIKYTEEAIELINIKIAGVADFFMTKFNEKVTEADEFSQIYNKFDTHQIEIDGKLFDISKISKNSYIKPNLPTLKGIKLIDLKELANNNNQILIQYEVRGRISYGAYEGKYRSYRPNVFPLDNNNPYILVDDEVPKGVKLEYIKYAYSNAIFLYKRGDRKLGKNDATPWSNSNSNIWTYRGLLKLGRYPKSQWRDRIKEYQSIEESELKKIPLSSTIIPTLEWLEERKANRKKAQRTNIGEQEITLKNGRRAERGTKNEMAFDQMKPVKIKELGKVYKSLIIYGINNQKELLDKYGPLSFSPSKGKSRVKFVIINKYDVKKVKNSSNLISIEEFMEGKSKPFKAFATAILINRLKTKYIRQFEQIAFIDSLSNSLAVDMRKLEHYEEVNYPSPYYGNDNFFNEITKIAIENKLLDTNIIDVYNRVEETLKAYDFIAFLNISKHSIYEPLRKLSIEILKGRKQKMDWTNYIEPLIVVEDNPDEEGEDDEENETNEEIAPIASELEKDIETDINAEGEEDLEFQDTLDLLSVDHINKSKIEQNELI